MIDILPYARADAGSPPSLFPDYRATVARTSTQPLVRVQQTLTEMTGPAGWGCLMGPALADLTTQHEKSPRGQRIIVTGRVLDDACRPVPDTVLAELFLLAAGSAEAMATVAEGLEIGDGEIASNLRVADTGTDIGKSEAIVAAILARRRMPH